MAGYVLVFFNTAATQTIDWPDCRYQLDGMLRFFQKPIMNSKYIAVHCLNLNVIVCLMNRDRLSSCYLLLVFAFSKSKVK